MQKLTDTLFSRYAYAVGAALSLLFTYIYIGHFTIIEHLLAAALFPGLALLIFYVVSSCGVALYLFLSFILREAFSSRAGIIIFCSVIAALFVIYFLFYFGQEPAVL